MIIASRAHREPLVRMCLNVIWSIPRNPFDRRSLALFVPGQFFKCVRPCAKKAERNLLASLRLNLKNSSHKPILQYTSSPFNSFD